MRPVDVLIIGMLLAVIGRTEQIRDGMKASSALVCNVLGVTLALGGWIWWCLTV